MKLNKVLLVTSAITMSLFVGAANADVTDGKETGTIHFKGQFVDSTCSIETNNENSNEGTVQLGTWLVSNLQNANETTTPTKFVIALNGCPDVIKKAKITFSGTANATNPSLYKTTTDVGAGIGITHNESDAAYITPGEPAGEIELTGASNSGEKAYYARYVTTEAAKAGAANADVTVTISYNQ
ncbi:type 1 fimbrial protein [Providencia vermicola]|uniref:fimbrial protein n=1 Tax=Providencia vermicola TaxID=333965 RepID=UPI0013A79E47|nr:fimbrial protein [Providencia vermicola]QIC15102.1 type 1 fimbrial protein [Providencia vermicola]